MHALHLEIPEQLGDVAAIVLVVLGIAAAVSGVGRVDAERAGDAGGPPAARRRHRLGADRRVLVVTTVLLALAIFVL